MATEAPPSGSLVRWVLPIGLFVVIVGAIAWVSQNLPKGAVQKVDNGNEFIVPTGKPADLQFLRTKALWDENDPNYFKESETGLPGYYDFPFKNPGSAPITLGFAQSSCDCSQLKVVALNPDAAASIEESHQKNRIKFPSDPAWTWTVLAPNDKEGIQVPANGGGVARIEWDGRKGASGKAANLKIKMWMQPTGTTGERSFETLDVPVVMAEPLRFSTDRIPLGVIGAGGQISGELLAWSPTRDNLELKVDPAKKDPLFEVSVEKLDAKVAAALQEKSFVASVAHLDTKAADERLASLRDSAKTTRFRSAFQIKVTLREQKDGKQLDQGPFSRELPLVAAELPVELPKPTVVAYVRGDVDVGIPEDAGKITLNFRARDGIKKTVPLWSEAGNDLELVSKYPTVLYVNLNRNAKESTAARTKWSLEISVPPGAWSGPFLEDSVIYLRTTTTPPRRIRIPVIGNAGQG